SPRPRRRRRPLRTPDPSWVPPGRERSKARAIDDQDLVRRIALARPITGAEELHELGVVAPGVRQAGARAGARDGQRRGIGREARRQGGDLGAVRTSREEVVVRARGKSPGDERDEPARRKDEHAAGSRERTRDRRGGRRDGAERTARL